MEKLGSEMARLVGVPAARVELATRGSLSGALVEDVRLPDWELQAGQALLPEVVDDYDPSDPEGRGYNVHSIRQALTRFASPPGSPMPTPFGAFDAFAGYLVFDALIAHGDRHDRNWAVLVPPPDVSEPEALCPSFDHAASLGFTLSDQRRAEHLRDGTVMKWAEHGYASRFEHRKGTRWQTLVELAGHAIGLCGPSTRQYWCERILSVEAESVEDLFAAAPGMTETAYRFTVELVKVNRGRLLDVLR